MNKSTIQFSRIISRNGSILSGLFLWAMLIAVQYTQFADSGKPVSIYTNMFSDGAHKLQSVAHDTNNNHQKTPSEINIDIENQGNSSPPPPADFNFVAAGDWSCNPDSSRTVRNIIMRSPELVLGPGDYSYEPTADCWFKTIAPIDSITRIAFGNHEVESSALTNQYLSHFGLQEQFYSFNYQNVHFLVVSSEIPYSVGTEQYNFVNNDLASAASNSSIDWIIAYHHKMQYSSKATHTSELSLRQALHPLFDKYGVDLVLQGHNHSYERTYPIKYHSASPFSGPVIRDTSTSKYNDSTGVIYVTAGIGGADNSPYIEKKPYSIIQWIGHGFLNIDIPNKGLTMKVTQYSNDGMINDSFTLDKSGRTATANTENSATTASSIASSTNTDTRMTPANSLKFVKNPSKPILLGHTEPDVIRVGDEFYMYYRNDATAEPSINVMSSNDGLKWVELGSILSNSSSGWDSAEIIAPSVYFDGNTYYLYYEATDAKAPGKRGIGVATATSPTGPFTKYFGNPILSPTLQWEGTSSSSFGIVGTPVITKASNDTFYLFYHGFSDGADKVGVAYGNTPLGPWTKEANNPILGLGAPGSWDDTKVAPSSVYFDGGSKLMVFYEGSNDKQEPAINWRIGIATGTINPADGRIKSLTRQGAPAINLGSPGSWDDTTIQLPSVIQAGDELWVYYSGNDGKAFRLGRAVALLT